MHINGVLIRFHQIKLVQKILTKPSKRQRQRHETSLISYLTYHVESMLRSLGNPAVQHNFRETNGAADILADFGSSSLVSSYVLLSPPYIVAAQLKRDRQEVSTTRIIFIACYNKLVSVGNQSLLSAAMSSIYAGSLSDVNLHSSSASVLAPSPSSTLLCPQELQYL
ncbi:hypothetical protein FXO38_05788 [Capsicum annuum]|nr:hypothetical protein FXO38_05788 [Capsicum annuum]